jgi:hypothetical protein
MSNLKGFQQTEPLPHLLRPLGSVGIQASHYGLGLLSGEKTEQILLHVETRRDELANLIHNTKP